MRALSITFHRPQRKRPVPMPLIGISGAFLASAALWVLIIRYPVVMGLAYLSMFVAVLVAAAIRTEVRHP